MPIVHAPAPRLAEAHPSWVRLIEKGDSEGKELAPHRISRKTGTYEHYARPIEPRRRRTHQNPRQTRNASTSYRSKAKKPSSPPAKNSTRWCKQQGILWSSSIYGFNTQQLDPMRNRTQPRICPPPSACRKAEMPIVHAPAQTLAEAHSSWKCSDTIL